VAAPEPTTRRPVRRFGVTAVLAAAVAALAIVRHRGQWPSYARFHRWLDEQGWPEVLRNVDGDLLLVVLGLLVWGLMRAAAPRASRGLLDDLGLRTDLLRGLALGAVVALPMLLLGAFVGEVRVGASMLRLALVGPVAEEVFFRGVLVLAAARLLAAPFWPTAVVAGALFGVAHVHWSLAGLLAGWPLMLITTAGGIWFAWLARAWARNLYLVIALHMLMNLASPWYDAASHAAVWHEVGRGATIAVSVFLTLLLAPRRQPT
jgi:membrane protease YdiL (CAAX protease family)